MSGGLMLILSFTSTVVVVERRALRSQRSPPAFSRRLFPLCLFLRSAAAAAATTGKTPGE